MTKAKSKSELEYLRGIVRELRSENKHLKKLVSRSNKALTRLEANASEPEEDTEELAAIESTGTPCPTCGKGEELRVDIGVKTLIKYTDCTHRRTEKK